MKKRIPWYILCLISLSVIFAGCSEDKYYGSGIKSELNGIYSTKTYAQPNAGTLSLTYSGGFLYGKDAYFEMTGKETAKIVLLNILPGEKEAEIKNIRLEPSAGGGYVFQGNAVSAEGTSLQYMGTVARGDMQLALSDIAIPANPLTAKGTWKMVEGSERKYTEDNGGIAPDDVVEKRYCAFLNMEFEEGHGETLQFMLNLVPNLINNVMYLLLDEVTFRPDGNITAKYADGFPEDFIDNIFGYLFGFPGPGDRSEVFESPINLARYLVDGNDVYVVPDLEMIIRLVESNNAARTRQEAGGESEMLEILKEVYKVLNEWTTRGVKLNFRENDLSYAVEHTGWSTITRYQGDYVLSLQGTEIAFLKKVLPYIPQLLGDELLNTEIELLEFTVGELLDILIDEMLYISKFEFGLLLYLDN